VTRLRFGLCIPNGPFRSRLGATSRRCPGMDECRHSSLAVGLIGWFGRWPLAAREGLSARSLGRSCFGLPFRRPGGTQIQSGPCCGPVVALQPGLVQAVHSFRRLAVWSQLQLVFHSDVLQPSPSTTPPNQLCPRSPGSHGATETHAFLIQVALQIQTYRLFPAPRTVRSCEPPTRSGQRCRYLDLSKVAAIHS